MSREAIVNQMQKWMGAKTGSAIHKNILAIYNTQNPLPRGHKMVAKDDWCCATVTAAAIATDNADIIPGECSCGKMIELMKTKGIFVEEDSYIPSPGDIMFFSWKDPNPTADNTTGHDHVGIVESYDEKTNIITTIEGNYDGEVKRRKIKVNGKYIRGFGVPKYDDTAKPIQKIDNSKIDSARSKDTKFARSYVATASINLRSGAGLSKKVITLIPKGNVVKCYGFYTSIVGIKWFLVQTTIKGVLYTGFCHSGYLK